MSNLYFRNRRPDDPFPYRTGFSCSADAESDKNLVVSVGETRTEEAMLFSFLKIIYFQYSNHLVRPHFNKRISNEDSLLSCSSPLNSILKCILNLNELQTNLTYNRQENSNQCIYYAQESQLTPSVAKSSRVCTNCAWFS